MSKIEQLINEIEAYIDECKPQAFTNNKKIIVEKDVLDELLEELRSRTPEEIKKYQKIISSKDAILADAQTQADAMIREANEKTANLINEHEIMQRALAQANGLMEQSNAQAQKLIDDAAAEANSVRESAVHYTDEMLKSMQTIISHAMENSQNKFNAYLASLQSSYDIIVSNRKELAGEDSGSEEEADNSASSNDTSAEE